MYRILEGDVMEMLRTLPDESVQCCITSPPYWGLRDYGLPASVWPVPQSNAGGDARATADRKVGATNCEHEWVTEEVEREMRRGLGLKDSVANTRGGAIKAAEVGWQRFERGSCRLCGAWRGCLGLEPTPEMYVEHLVSVFREVRRVLRNDGVLFLNLGDSYYSRPAKGGSGTFNGRNGRGEGYARGRSATSCDTSDRELVDYPASDCPSENLCDECREAALRKSHRDCQRGPTPIASPCEPILACKVSAHGHLPTSDSFLREDHSAVAIESPEQSAFLSDAPLPVSPLSTQFQSSEQLQGECLHCANCGACLSVLRSSSRDGSLCARRFARNSGSSSLVLPSYDHSGSVFGGAAYRDSTTQYLKPKDLVGIPWMVAFALRADGWYLRQDIIWAKPNPMPESVTDRCTKAHEYLFLLTKSARYFYDQEAVKEAGTEIRKCGADSRENADRDPQHKERKQNGGDDRNFADGREGIAMRNKRDVWTIATQPYREAHFATFPEKLIEPCILAGTSERGCCPQCGAPWRRVVEKETLFISGSGRAGNPPQGKNAGSVQALSGDYDIRMGPINRTETTGWRPGCKCGDVEIGAGGDARATADREVGATQYAAPGIVLDCFAGAGTCGVVALRHGRDFIGIELNAKYAEMARRRIENDRPLFNSEQRTGNRDQGKTNRPLIA